jgi:hypothetical protein
MTSLDELQIGLPLFFTATGKIEKWIISGNFDSEKVDQDEIF